MKEIIIIIITTIITPIIITIIITITTMQIITVNQVENARARIASKSLI
jgi:hypothetical protein